MRMKCAALAEAEAEALALAEVAALAEAIALALVIISDKMSPFCTHLKRVPGNSVRRGTLKIPET